MFNQQNYLAMARQQAQQQVAALPPPKWGYITSFNPKTYAVRVRLEPDSSGNEASGLPAAETNWLPLLRTFGGHGWGDFQAPKANPNPPYGDACLVVFPDHGQGVAISGFYTDVERPATSLSLPSPDAVPTTHADGDGVPQWGERWFIGPKGNKVQVLNDGSIRLTGQDGSYIQIVPNADGSIFLHIAGGSSVEVDADGSIRLISLIGNSITINADGSIDLTSSGANVNTNGLGFLHKSSLLGFFSTGPVARQSSGVSALPGSGTATFTADDQTALTNIRLALIAYGLLSS